MVEDVMAESNEDDLDEIFALYLSACDTGELTSRDDFLNQHPEHADQLRELMDAADLIGTFSMAGSDAKGTSGPWTEPITLPPDAEVSDQAAQLASTASQIDVQTDMADTIGIGTALSADGLGEHSNVDPNLTLPMANRSQGDSGPSLPFDLGDYQLLKVLGVGGMGVVYLAKQRELDRLVAVKMIRSGILAGQDEVKRFYTEAKAAAKLKHPNIVAVHQFGRRAGHHFFSMQYVEGEDLQKVLAKGPLPSRRAAEIVRDVAHAIHHAHSRGVLHRDLKPGNVLIDPSGQVHVTDFGLAKHTDADSSVTGSGAAVGTPHYMAPEQALGHSDRVTHHSDIYSLGAILFAAITSRPPIVGDTVMQTLLKVAHQPPPTLRSVCPEAESDLEVIVAKCLEKQPKDRYKTAKNLADDLNRFLCGQTIHARSRSRARKVVDWFGQVPVVAAVTGRQTSGTPVGQRRFQNGILSASLILPLLLFGGLVWQQRINNAMPTQIRIAGGLPGGLYNRVSEQLSKTLQSQTSVPCEVIGTNGTWDNRERLIAGEFELAPIQATAVNGETLRVVAPLFYEAVHVLIRDDSEIDSVEDLSGQRIAVGPHGSGSRRAAEMVLESLGLSESVSPRVEMPWDTLQETNPKVSAEAAIICIGVGSDLVTRMLAEQRWHLLPLPDGVSIALQHPTLHAMTIATDAYAGSSIPPSGIHTVGTTAFLVCRDSAPDPLIESTLQALYEEPSIVGLIPARQAAEWQGLAFHRISRRYYDDLEARLANTQ
ncbi:serine/threonine protein kinase [Rhodopirellula baltica SH28]|uniref:non-specific serine/threonine protein kinase n=1 Tax=Rhodopirellula baltica SH28 TaxID=993517 RepID=K5C7X7_RHOBT|nr:serine/threonine-protein kinase [Rhodopirellula baltica]EKJ99024.1 serine/threonine protein kinase [Rhodopirellula baltica SH28]